LFVCTDATGDEYNNFTHEIKPGPKPNLSIISKKETPTPPYQKLSQHPMTPISQECWSWASLECLGVVKSVPSQHEACLIF